MDTSGKALIEHWDWAAEKGIMNKNTAVALRAACSQVLSVIEDSEDIDIKIIDVEDILSRFQNLRGKDYKPQTLNAYKRRFRQAVDYFLGYTEDPSNWKPPISQTRSSSKSTDVGNQKRKAVNTAAEQKKTPPPDVSGEDLVRYPYPLRDDLVVYLYLPSDLKSIEVKRLAAFMTTLTVDFEVNDVFHQM